jgi:four helix bundle protein
MPFLFEKLDVYNKSMQLADEVTTLVETFPSGKYYLKDQINRAILSVPNNIAEGNGRFTNNDKIHFFHIARGSAFECVSILEMCRRKKLITSKENEEFKQMLDDICKMLSGLIKRHEG